MLVYIVIVNIRCIHKRNKWKCKKCKGKSVCEHNNIRSICKGCKGGSICEHNNIRSTCKDCITDKKT